MTPPAAWETVRVFVSSTFEDMHAERDLLVKRVFPELAEWCEQRRLHLIDVDLRWGVTEENATRNRNAVASCLSAVDECRPFFLCFLGQRYGWVPHAEDISDETLARYPGLGDAVAGHASATELEVLHALVAPFHRSDARDRRATLARRSLIFVRDPSYLEEMPARPPYRRRLYSDDEEEDGTTREFLLDGRRRLRGIVAQAASPVLTYEARWSEEVTSPESALPLECAALLEQNEARWRRRWREAADLEIAGAEIEPGSAAYAVAAAANEQLACGRLTQFRCDGRPLEEVVLERLKDAITTEFPTHAPAERGSDLARELDQQAHYRFLAGAGFIGRTGDFDELDRYAEAPRNRPFVLTAPAGAGKSTLLANWLDRLSTKGRRSVHYRFAGQSDGSTTVDGVLRSILEELKAAGKLDADPPADPQLLRQEWSALLGAAAERGGVVVAVDALNQIESGLVDIDWLPSLLPAHVALVVSFTSSAPGAAALLKSSRRRGATVSEVRPFVDLDNRRELVQGYLGRYLKALDEHHTEQLIRSAGATNPLFLKVVLAELRLYGVFEDLGTRIREDFGETPQSAFDAVLARLEVDPIPVSLPPQTAVPELFGLLAHARRGLSAAELAEAAFGGEAAGVGLDTAHVFLRQVRAFLGRREGRYDYFFDSFREAARARYAAPLARDGPLSRPASAWHGALARYFADLPVVGSRPALRRLDELPYHQAHAGDADSLRATLTDFEFLMAKAGTAGIRPLIADFAEARICGVATDPLPVLHETLEGAAHVLDADPGQLGSQLLGRIRPDGTELERMAKQIAVEQPGTWLRPLVPSLSGGHRSTRVLSGHDAGVTSLAMAPGGHTAISADTDGALCVWDVRTWRLVRRITLPTDLGDDAEVRMQSVGIQFGNQIQAGLREMGSMVTSMALDRDRRIALVGLGGKVTAHVVDLERGLPRHVLRGHSGPLYAVDLTPDGRMAATGSSDGTVRLWQLPRSGRAEILADHVLVGHTDMVTAVAFAHGDRRVVSAGWDRMIRVWDVASGRQLTRFRTGRRVGTLCVAEDGVRLAALCRDSVVRVWNLDPTPGRVRGLLRRPSQRSVSDRDDPILAMTMSPDGDRLICVSGSAVDQHDAATGDRSAIIAALPRIAPTRFVAITTDSRYVLTADSNDGKLMVWSLASSGNTPVTNVGRIVRAAAVTPGGTRGVVGDYDGRISVWDLERCEVIDVMIGHDGPVMAVAITADGGMAVSGSKDKTVRVWDLLGGGSRVLRGHGQPVNAVGITEDRRWVVSGSSDETVRIWDLTDGGRLHTTRSIHAHDAADASRGEVTALAITPDGTRCATAAGDGITLVWPGPASWQLQDLLAALAVPSQTRQLTSPGPVNAVAMNPDGTVLVVGELGGGVKVWNLEGNGNAQELPTGGQEVWGVATNFDASHILVAQGEHLDLWDRAGEERLARFTVDGNVATCAMSADGRTILAGDDRGAVHVLRLEVGDHAR